MELSWAKVRTLLTAGQESLREPEERIGCSHEPSQNVAGRRRRRRPRPRRLARRGHRGTLVALLPGGDGPRTVGERARGRIRNRTRPAHERRGQVLQRRLRPELPRPGVDRIRDRPEERGLPPRVLLQDVVEHAAGRDRRGPRAQRRLRRLQGVGRGARLPLLLPGRPALQALPRPRGRAAVPERAAVHLQRAGGERRPHRRALLRQVHGGRLRGRPGLLLRPQRERGPRHRGRAPLPDQPERRRGPGGHGPRADQRHGLALVGAGARDA